MMDQTHEKYYKLRDIQKIDFGKVREEIISSINFLRVMLETDEDPEILEASRKKIEEGYQLLKILEKRARQS
jgi:hypothetical protein